MIRVGESIRLRGAYVKSGVGVAGLTVTLSYTDEAGNATTGLTATAGAIAGEYYYALTPDAAGIWLFKMVTAGDVDTKEIFGVIEVEAALTATRAANLDNLDASVDGVAADVWVQTTRSLSEWTAMAASIANSVWSLTARTLSSHGVSGVATGVWAASTRTLSSYGTLVADVAAAVWGAGARTLSGFGTLVTDIWNQVLTSLSIPLSASSYLKASGAATDPLLNPVPGSYAQGTAGQALGRIGSGTIATVSLISPPGTALTLVRGDDYALADGRAIAFTLATTWPDLTGATVVLTVRSRASDALLFSVSDRVASRVTGAGVAQVVVFEPSASVTASLAPGLASGKFDIQATLASGHIVTVATGLVTVAEDQTR